MQPVETDRPRKCRPIPELSPRIVVFRPFLDQLPKLDVAGSTPVARSLLSARKTGRLLVAPLRADAMGGVYVPRSPTASPFTRLEGRHQPAERPYESIG